jgi:Ca-activated chloride channel family protein
MRAEVKLSTKFLVTQNAHQVAVLTTLSGETPVKRAPINVALVLDRSGSMSGLALAAAKEAAARFTRFLSPADRLALVAFDDQVHVYWGPGAAGDPSVLGAIERIHSGGSTNLSGGWLKGMQLVGAKPVDGVNRVVLLTDGQANVGVVTPDTLAGMARGAAGKRVSTTCIGFGGHFNEDLLQAMAQGGGGNYWYVERDDQMAGIFAGEIEGLVSLAAQNVEVEIVPLHPRVAGVSFLQGYPVARTDAGGWRATLGDLYATSPLALGLLLHVEDVAELGPANVAEVRVEADVVLADGIEHRRIIMPVVANFDGADHPDPIVEKTLLRFEAARAREEAIRRADAGDYDGAANALSAASAGLVPYQAETAVAEEIADLDTEAARLREQRYDAADRKYHAARAVASSRGREDYVAKLSRRRDR